MTEDIRTVRQWQGQYLAGAFESKNLDDQWKAGWRGFSCHFDALAGRLRYVAPMILRIQEPFILDHYTLWLENVMAPGRRAAYDRARFQPLDSEREGLSFRVDFKNPDQPKKWALFTERYGSDAPEYGCAGAYELAGYINNMARELERGFQPDFLREKQAVAAFLQKHGGIESAAVYREGDHLYSYYKDTPCNPMSKRLLAAYTPEALSPGARSTGMERIGDIYVFDGSVLERFSVQARRTAKAKHCHKRRERER